MTKFIIILLSAVFINNYVLSKFLGICPFLGVSKKLDSATGMSVAVIFVMLLATAVTWPIQYFLLDPNDLGYLQTIVFILVIAALVQLVEIVLKRYIPALHKSLGVYLPLITTNCAVLGVTILNIDENYTFAEAMVNSLGSGLGFFKDRGRRRSRELQGSAGHAGGGVYHLSFLPRLRRSDREHVCVREGERCFRLF